MNKSDTTHFDFSRQVMLTYSTWLVVGGWLIFTGAELIYKGADADGAFFNYTFGVIRIFVGVNAFRTAKSVALKASEPSGSFIRLMTSLLATIMFGLPLLLFIFQTLVILFADYQPGEIYRQNIIRLLSIAICYMLAVVYTDWRLRK